MGKHIKVGEDGHRAKGEEKERESEREGGFGKEK